MQKLHTMGGLAGLALLAACSGGVTANVTTTVETGDANVVVPGDNGAAADTNAAAAETADAHAMPALKLDPEGLLLVDVESGEKRTVAFGAARDVAVPAIASALGKPLSASVNQECGAGPIEHVAFQGGLTLLVQGGKFGGWSLDGREGGGYATPGGVTIGSTLADLRKAAKKVDVEESTLGTEFMADGMSGLLDGKAATAKITDLWAGLSCVFR
ncbi:hypothetical protein ACFQ1E_11350 [Sphingomonas canadensis]|uniref:Uncharacterized protein n=1 Tax=Sphingomonas canadensis TaxID=1219257 RepID=A0ABW3H649_9SPHN|nr:hypothetical protein [Sphingomonas canadensis]MCW3836283.1 hypothetical protein [Sphingomonas canadensis]